MRFSQDFGFGSNSADFIEIIRIILNWKYFPLDLLLLSGIPAAESARIFNFLQPRRGVPCWIRDLHPWQGSEFFAVSNLENRQIIKRRSSHSSRILQNVYKILWNYLPLIPCQSVYILEPVSYISLFTPKRLWSNPLLPISSFIYHKDLKN